MTLFIQVICCQCLSQSVSRQKQYPFKCEKSGNPEFIHQGNSVIMIYDMSECNEILKLMNLLQENHIRYIAA